MYMIDQAQAVAENTMLTTTETARLIGTNVKRLQRLDDEGIFTARRVPYNNRRYYTRDDIPALRATLDSYRSRPVRKKIINIVSKYTALLNAVTSICSIKGKAYIEELNSITSNDLEYPGDLNVSTPEELRDYIEHGTNAAEMDLLPNFIRTFLAEDIDYLIIKTLLNFKAVPGLNYTGPIRQAAPKPGLAEPEPGLAENIPEESRIEPVIQPEPAPEAEPATINNEAEQLIEPTMSGRPLFTLTPADDVIDNIIEEQPAPQSFNPAVDLAAIHSAFEEEAKPKPGLLSRFDSYFGRNK